MEPMLATAISCPNIAFIKYWGDRDPLLRLPANGSISMNLDGLQTRTRVTFDPTLPHDTLSIDGSAVTGPGLERLSTVLDTVRRKARISLHAHIESENNFPTGAGLASSASAFAALSLAASAAAGLALNERDLSRLARLGSGSACRSVPGGYVEWQPGEGEQDSFAFSIAPSGHWDLVDCIAIVSQAHKSTSSSEGHALAHTSPLQSSRLESVPILLAQCRRAILEKDFELLATVTELDCHQMHAVMMTSSPPLIYWLPSTLAVIQSVREWRSRGTPVCYTIDAGPNVHVLCPSPHQSQVASDLRLIPGVHQVLVAPAGGPARLEFR